MSTLAEGLGLEELTGEGEALTLIIGFTDAFGEGEISGLGLGLSTTGLGLIEGSTE